MKKNRRPLLKRALAAVIPLTCVFSVSNFSPLYVSAAESSHDGIDASFSVASSNETEKLNAVLKLSNTNKFDIENVKLEFEEPTGYELITDSYLSKIDVLKSNEPISMNIEFEKIKLSNNGNVNNTSTNQTSNNSSKKEDTSTNSTGNNNNSNNLTSSSPGTGDTFPIALLSSILAGSSVVAFVCIKKKKGKQFLSLFLVGAMCGTLATELKAIPVSAAVEVRSFSLEEMANGVNVKLTITYDYPSGETKSENISFNMEGTLYDKDTDTYYLFDEKNHLDGSIEKYEDLKKISYKITDCNDTELMKGEMVPSETWSIDNLGLIVGDNKVTISLEHDDSSIETSSIKINNLCEDNMSPLDIDKGDDDNDGVLNFIEVMYHTNPKNSDSDGDKLSDYDEMAILGTDPMKKDSDGNGIEDNKEDADGDKLDNYDEIYVYNSDPDCIDSDGDGLSDYDEVITYKTNPNMIDTDADSADDYWEVKNNFDPLNYTEDFGELDPNGNSIVTTENGSEITVVVSDSFLNESTPGYMGVDPYHVELGDNSSTELSVPMIGINLSADDQPTLYYFNKETQRVEEVSTTIADGKATATVSKNGDYVLLNRRYVSEVWDNDFIDPSKIGISEGSMDVVFVVDCSGSMADNDPNNTRVRVMKDFIDKLRDEDRASIVKYTDSAQTVVGITPNKDDLKNALDNGAVYTESGCGAGTNGATGIRNALDELNDSTASNKYIIFLTDGYDTSHPSDYTYDDLVNEANSENMNVTIHTIGLVGTGDVDIELLKSISEKTGGNYYLATTGEEAENVPDDVLLLEDIYKDIESITIDSRDSNDDGINDYYTKLICDGKILASNGKPIFGDATYDEVQANADYDGDGIINGTKINPETGEILEKGEIEIAADGMGVYAKIYSYPTIIDSDSDSLNDYIEAKTVGTSPLKFNTNVRKKSVDIVTNNDYYQSSYWRELYNSSFLVRGSVYIGNAFYGTTIIQESFYEKVLNDYFTDLNKELFKYEKNCNEKAFLASMTEEMFREDFQRCYYELENGDDSSLRSSIKDLTSLLNDFCDVAGLGENAVSSIESYNELLNIANGNQAELNYINSILNKVNINIGNLAYTIDSIGDSQALNSYADALESIKGEFSVASETMQVKMNSTFLARIGKGISTVDGGVKEALPILDKAAKVGDVFTVISIGVNSYNSLKDAREEYAGFMTNLEIMQKNIYILDAICATTENTYLRSAANNIRYDVQNSMNDLLSIVSLGTDTYGNAIISIELEVLHALCQKIPYTMPFEIVRTIGNVFFHTAEQSETITNSVAAAEIANVLSKHFMNGLTSGNASDGNGQLDKWVAYHDYSADMYIYLLNLAIIRRNSEKYVIEKENIGLPSETRENCEYMISLCNDVVTEYFPKLQFFNMLQTSNKS